MLANYEITALLRDWANCFQIFLKLCLLARFHAKRYSEWSCHWTQPDATKQSVFRKMNIEAAPTKNCLHHCTNNTRSNVLPPSGKWWSAVPHNKKQGNNLEKNRGNAASFRAVPYMLPAEQNSVSPITKCSLRSACTKSGDGPERLGKCRLFYRRHSAQAHLHSANRES